MAEVLNLFWACFERVLSSGFVLSNQQGKQKEAEQARAKFAGDTRSDHLALLNAFQVSCPPAISAFCLFLSTFCIKTALN